MLMYGRDQHNIIIILQEKKEKMAVQWLILCASNAEGVSLFPGRRTVIPYAARTAKISI